MLSRLDTAGIWYCVEGGWGVDALLREQRREHGDLDLGVRMEEVGQLCSALAEFTRDDAEWPSGVILTDRRGRRVDAHPLAFDDAGDGWQVNDRGGEPYRWPGEHVDSRGRIAGREVRCISPELQLRWHEHEDFDDVDWVDLGVLAGRFGLPAPGPRPGFISAPRARDKKSQPRHEG